ncbi:hypothetical protein GF380_04825 [Candidatus Uhrbacteria bacterium]|nr:hypothetical protein [Candidatus Uhrbacteria bacterium]MBD3284370.1 hypothetical protein [Candidatus Uhrbacteria bacterium]
MRQDPFSHLVGHQTARRVLTHHLDRPLHGYLLVGLDGVGCHPMAEAFVRALVGLDPSASLSSHPDIVLLEREFSDSGKTLKAEISVKRVRELRMRMAQRPSIAPRVVAYLPDADHLNTEGVNALLTCIEEPVAGAVYVLVAHRESRLPGTLRSRLARIGLSRVSTAEIGSWLSTQGADERLNEAAVAFAEGRPGIARRYVKDAAYREEVRQAERIIDRILTSHTPGEAFAVIADTASACDAAEDSVTEWRKTLQLWQSALRRRFADHPFRAYGIAHALIQTERNLGGPVSPRIWLELGLRRVSTDQTLVFPGLLAPAFPYPLELRG